jgi:hypothetical protein
MAFYTRAIVRWISRVSALMAKALAAVVHK